MRKIFNDHDTEAVILVDASNAFNSLNRQVAFHHIRIICPAFSTILINTYREPTLLVVSGGKEMLSKEGTTQGDNLAMAFYALGTKPIQDALKLISPQTIQVWLADDATGSSSLINLKAWWDTIITEGPKFGYYVNESKSWLIVKDASQLDYTKELFSDTAIKYTTEGKRHLGATIGSADFRAAYATEKVKEWCDEMEILSDFAKSQPQSAYAVFIHGEQHRFSYFLRTIPGMEIYMEPLDKVINDKFIPTLFGTPLTHSERNLFSLPVRCGGLSIPIFTAKSNI